MKEIWIWIFCLVVVNLLIFIGDKIQQQNPDYGGSQGGEATGFMLIFVWFLFAFSAVMRIAAHFAWKLFHGG